MRYYIKRDETRKIVLSELLMLPKTRMVAPMTHTDEQERLVVQRAAEIIERLADFPNLMFAAEPTDYACMGVFVLLDELSIRNQYASDPLDDVMQVISEGLSRYPNREFIFHYMEVRIWQEDKYRLTLIYERVDVEEHSLTQLFRHHFIDSFLAENA